MLRHSFSQSTMDARASSDTLVSVVIPTYNYARFVGEAIDSTLAQTHRPIEVVVVDDGSTDDTPALLARYGDRIVAIRKANGGLAAARNTGIRAARGEFFALLDADDSWLPEKIERQLALFRSRPDAGAVGTWTQPVGQEGQLKPVRRFSDIEGSREKRLREVLLRESWVGGSGSGALIARTTIESVGLFDETLQAAEDWDMWLRIAAQFPVYNVAAPLTWIREHQTGTFRNAEKMERNQWRVYEQQIARWPESYAPSVRRLARAMIELDSAGEHASSGKWWAAAKRSLQAILLQPRDIRAWRLLGNSFVRGLADALKPGVRP